MKLIRGRALAALLAANPALEDRFGAFEPVCLAVGSAREHGVIHRSYRLAIKRGRGQYDYPKAWLP